jgi:uncharacterized protein YndB with AHSA1/START domain
MSEWLMENDFFPKVGHKFVFRAKPQPGWRGYVECEVLECEPPRKLSYSWVGNDGQKATTVTWMLHEAPAGRGSCCVTPPSRASVDSCWPS